jgi:hypothetical protein
MAALIENPDRSSEPVDFLMAGRKERAERRRSDNVDEIIEL